MLLLRRGVGTRTPIAIGASSTFCQIRSSILIASSHGIPDVLHILSHIFLRAGCLSLSVVEYALYCVN
jgi:hypothetical protein